MVPVVCLVEDVFMCFLERLQLGHSADDIDAGTLSVLTSLCRFFFHPIGYEGRPVSHSENQ